MHTCDPKPNREVAFDLALHVEEVRIRELSLVAPGGRIHEHHY
jgi:hypothetical protein